MDTKEKNIHRIVGDGIGYDTILWVSSGSTGTVADLGGLLETWQQHFQNKELQEEAGHKIQEPPLQHPLASAYGLSEHPYKLGQGKDRISMKVATSESGCFLYHQQKEVKKLALAISKHLNDQTGVIQNQLNDEKIENPALYLVVDSEPNKNNNNPTMIHAVLYSQNKAEEETWQELCKKLFTLLEKENLCPANLYDDLQSFLEATTKID